MKSWTDLFVKRPVLALVLNAIILVAGIQAWGALSVRQYPRSENATVTVTTVYIGADAELIRGFITTPLERAIASADGIDYVKSESKLGLSTITARLKINYDATKALSEIGSKIDQVRGDLPPEAEVPVINVESADSEFAGAYLSFSSDFLQPNEVTEYLSRVVQPRLSALAGVQRADILGGRTFAMRIWLKPEKLAAYNISPVQIRQALNNNNYLSAIGQTKGALVQVNLTANTDLQTVEEFKKLVVLESQGSLVRLEDVADVVLGAEEYESEVRFSGEKAVFMGVWPLPNSNVLDVVRLVRAELDQLRKEMPEGFRGNIAYDSTKYIDDALKEVVKTLGETLLIVIVVIFLFLGSLRSVIIPVVAIPLSLIGAIFLMQFFGFTLNLLTLLAIVLSVGLVVDDAIIVVENAERRLRHGMGPVDAAMLGVRELVGPIIATTITLVSVYLPVGLQGGLTGSLFREFAITLAGAVVISTIVALTLSPMMSGALLRARDEEKGFTGWLNRRFRELRNSYGRTVDATLAARPAIYFAALLLTAFSVIMFSMANSGRELAPTEDQGVVFGIVNAAANASLESTVKSTEEANRVFESVPEFKYSFQITFPTGGFGGMIVAPWGERKRTVQEILPEVQGGLGAIPGIEMFPVPPPPLPGGGQFPFEFVIASTAEPQQILEFAEKLKAYGMQEGIFAFPPLIDTKLDQPQSELILDRDKVASLGLDLGTVGGDLSAMVGGAYVNRFNSFGRSYKVIPQVKRVDRLNPDQLKNIYVTGPGGDLVPLSTIGRLEQKVVPRSLNRFQQLNAVTISGVTMMPLGTALNIMETRAAELLPPGYVVDYTGESRQLKVEGDKFLPALALSIVLIFLTLAAQFNSFRDPFIILLGSVPLAFFAALITIFLKFPNPEMSFWTDGWTTSLNIYSQVGMVTLIGLVAKNGILIVEFANQLQLHGLSKLAAIRQASRVRLRPVLMTSVATVFGHLPLTLVTGAGAEARNSIGLVLVVGMTLGTIFTLFALPSLYMLFAKDRGGEKEMDEATDEEHAAPDGTPA